MTVIGIDDTDSRELGMCTMYAATRLAEKLDAAGVSVERTLLVRLHPAIEHKTRGNAALAVHCDADPGTALDAVDRVENTAVCVPRTPCPVLYGIRGETPAAVRAVADRIASEPAARRRVFVTNQGTAAHLRDAALSELADGGCYRVDATVATAPETREGGHVLLRLRDGGGGSESDGSERIRAAAFEPTKRFRDRVRALRPGDRVRALRPGDRVTACDEVGDGTLKLEKFAVRDLVRTELVTPTCPDCGRSMSSAGRNAGYRCRDYRTTAGGKVERPVERDLERGWYEVPPCARRHVAKPLVTGPPSGSSRPSDPVTCRGRCSQVGGCRRVAGFEFPTHNEVENPDGDAPEERGGRPRDCVTAVPVSRVQVDEKNHQQDELYCCDEYDEEKFQTDRETGLEEAHHTIQKYSGIKNTFHR